MNDLKIPKIGWEFDMFVVAVYNDYLIEGYYKQTSLVSLHQSTKSAQNKIDTILRNHKLSILKERQLQKVLSIYDGMRPSPLNEFDARKSKPAYDHSQKNVPEYEKQHLEAVNDWKRDILNPILIAKRKYDDDRIEFLKEQRMKIDEMKFSSEEIESVKVENSYRIEVIEVED